MIEPVINNNVIEFVHKQTEEERAVCDALQTLREYLQQMPSQADPTLRAVCTVLLAIVQEDTLCGNSDG